MGVPPFLNRAIIHNVSPGDSPERLAEECQAIGLDVKLVGLELDIVRRKSQGFCVASKDGSLHEPVEELLDRFSDHGFAGIIMLDCIERRTAGPLMKLLNDGSFASRYERCVLSANPMVLYFKAPGNKRMYAVEDFWDPENLVIVAHFAELLKGFGNSGAMMQWEPVPDAEDRDARTEFLSQYESILYKTPLCSITASFDTQACMEADFHYFKAHQVLEKLTLFGSLSHIRQVRKRWGAMTDALDNASDDASEK